MKNVVLKNSNKFAKVSKKLFTKKKEKDTIRKDYNPLKVNCKNYRRGSGLYMESEKLIIAKQLSKKYNKKEELILKMIEKCDEMGCSIKNIEEFFNK